MDIVSKERRSYIMSRIRSKNTKPEKALNLLLRSNGIIFKKQYNIPGKPDFVLIPFKLAIFVDGELWHGKKYHIFRHKYNEYWQNKIEKNIRRDKRNNRNLHKLGWHVMHFWGANVIKFPDKTIRRIEKFIEKNNVQQKGN